MLDDTRTCVTSYDTDSGSKRANTRLLRVVELSYLIYGLPMLGIWAWYSRKRHTFDRQSREAKQHAEKSGLAEPVSLHPLCGLWCVRACVP
jgi:hypothetical protein